MSCLPWKNILSFFDKLILGKSKRISFVVLFSSVIVILLFENWIDFIVPVCIFGVVWERIIKRRMPRRDIIKIVFWKVILFEVL